MISPAPAPAQIRQFFVPDEGMMLADIDLTKADFYVVVWEADELALKQMLHAGVEIYGEMTKDIPGASGLSYTARKSFVHAVDYIATPRTLAQFGLTVHAAEVAQRRYLQKYPGIARWHDRVRGALKASPPRIWNKLGYHRIFFGRQDNAMVREAVNWIAQSTVACVTNRGLVNIAEGVPWAEVLLQVHDSVLVQFPTERFAERAALCSAMQVVVPYDDPLVIPCGLKVSEVSWGDCRDVGWE